MKPFCLVVAFVVGWPLAAMAEPAAAASAETEGAASASEVRPAEEAAPQAAPQSSRDTGSQTGAEAVETAKAAPLRSPEPPPSWSSAAAEPVQATVAAPPAAPEAKGDFDDVSLSQLLEVTVVASKHAESIADAPSSITIITEEKIAALGLRYLNDALQLVPGFDVRRIREQTQVITVRGITSQLNERLLVMMDGVRLGDLYDGGAGKDVRQISLADVQRIEIIRGPGSALYGTGAFAAVVSIITKRGSDTKGIHMNGEVGSYGARAARITAGEKFGYFNLNGHFGYAESTGETFFIQQDAAGQQGYIRDPNKELFGNLKLQYKKMLELNASASHQAYPGFITTGDVFDPISFGKSTWVVTSLDFNHDFSKSLAWKTKGSFAYHHRGPTLAMLLPPGVKAAFPDGQYGHPNLDDYRYGLDSYVNYVPIQGMTLIAGGEAELDTTDNHDHVSSGPDYNYPGVTRTKFYDTPRRTVFAGYVQGDYKILQGLKLTAGMRYDHYNDFGGSTNPRVALVYNYRDKAWVKGLFAKAFRAPTYRELHATTPTIIGNPNSKAETIMTGELVFGIAPWRQLTATVSLFDSRVTNLIFSSTITDPSKTDGSKIGSFENRGNLDALGVEAEIKAEILPGLEVAGNYTYVHSKSSDHNKTTNLDFSYGTPAVSHHTANFTVSRDLYKHLRISVLGEYRSAKTRYLVAGDPTSDPRPPCGEVLLIGAYARVYDMVEGVAGYLRVTNALNTQYSTPSNYPAKVPGVIPDDIHNRGIEIQTGLTYSFK